MVRFGIMESNDISELKEELFKLMAQQTTIENEMQQHFQTLSANNIGMNDSLTDSEGYPLANVDLYQVTTARQRIRCCRNDLRALMNRMAEGLHEIHARSKPVGDEPMVEDEQLPEAFASITLVSPGSPAELCGMKVGDSVLVFGSVNKSNFKSMQDLAGVVQHSLGNKISVVVRRKGRNAPLSLDLMPQQWSGQGLIGCKIDPFETIER